MAYAIGTRSAASHRRRDPPLHALMIGVMAVTMIVASPMVTVAGAGVLLVASIVCAGFSRTRHYLREHVVDLWAMALTLLAFLPWRGVGHHAMSVPSVAAFAVVVAAWAASRVWLGTRGGSVARRAAAASGAVTGAGLVAMAVFCV